MGFIAGAAGQPAQAPDGLTGLGIKAVFSADADTTFLSTMTDVQIANLTTARIYTLPSTDPSTGATVKAGRELIFKNRGSFNLSFNSSAGTAMTVANVATGSVGDPTIRNGYVRLRALQDAPTTPAHWLVEEVSDEYSAVATFTHPEFSPTSQVVVTRQNKVASIRIQDFTTAGSIVTGGSVLVATGFLPLRFRPAVPFFVGAISKSIGAAVAGAFAISTSGSLTVYQNYSGSGFSSGGTAGFGQTSNTQFFSYPLA